MSICWRCHYYYCHALIGYVYVFIVYNISAIFHQMHFRALFAGIFRLFAICISLLANVLDLLLHNDQTSLCYLFTHCYLWPWTLNKEIKYMSIYSTMKCTSESEQMQLARCIHKQMENRELPDFQFDQNENNTITKK